MDGRIVGLGIVGAAAIAGAAMYWLQVYAYYDRVAPEGAHAMALVTREGAPFSLRVSDWQGIDAASSPQRFRACFRTALPAGMDFQPYEGAEPLVGPPWFSCFDARGIGEALAAGEARAYLGQRDIHRDVDRVIAIYPDGRAYAWQQLNPSVKE